MDPLPTAEERDWLLDRLAELIEARGHETFVTAPILEPSDRFFPDEFSRDVRGVYILARRMLVYAGLGTLDVHVEVFEPGAIPGPPGASRHREAAAWFAGIQDGRCILGANVRLLTDVEQLPAAMGHEVAHAFRTWHDLRSADPMEEEFLTDLTTVYLGFGILASNASYRYRSSGEQRGAMTVTRWSQQWLGYLPPQALCFLLAAQAVARGLGDAERRHIGSLLEANQAGYFRAACRQFVSEDLLRRLSIPDRKEWPPPPALAQLARPLEGVPERGAFQDVPKPRDPRTLNAGRKVFRVRNTQAPRGALAGGLSCTLLAGVGVAGLHLPVAFLSLPAVGFVAGLLWGRTKRADYCSDPRCQWRMGLDDVHCPGCAGTIAGEIRSPGERLEAEERLRGLERARTDDRAG